MTTDEYQVHDVRALDVVDLVYGGGIAYGANRSSRRLVEFDCNNPLSIKVVGQSDELPAEPTAVAIANLSDELGVSVNVYNSEFLRGGIVARTTFTQVNWIRDLANFGETFILDRIPFDVDFNHYGFELGFHFIAPEDAEYRFTFATDDGVRVWIEGEAVISSWKNQGGDLTDVTRQYRRTLRKGEPLFFFVEYSDSKAIIGHLVLHYGINIVEGDTDATNDPIVPSNLLRAVYRMGKRVDEVTAAGTEVLPAIGGCFAVAEGWLFSYPRGAAQPGTHTQVRSSNGNAIVGTKWGRVLLTTDIGVELWETADLAGPEARCDLGFKAVSLISLSGSLILAVAQDGRYKVLDVTDEIEPQNSGILQHARNVFGGYFSKNIIPVVPPTVAYPELTITGDIDAVYVYELQTINDEVVFVFKARTRIDSLKDVTPYGITFNLANGGDGEFKSTLDPAADQTIKFNFSRRVAVGIRQGFMVAHKGVGITTVFHDDTLPQAIGLDFPFFPSPDVRFRFKNAGKSVFGDDLGTSRGTTSIVINPRQVIEPALGWVSPDEIVVTTVPTFTPPGALLIEHTQGLDFDFFPFDKKIQIIRLGVAEFFRMEAEFTAGSQSIYEFYLLGVPMTVINPAPFSAWTSSKPDTPISFYHQTMIIFRANSVDVWQDGVLLRSDVVTYPSGIVPTDLFKFFHDPVTATTPPYASLSDAQLFINQDITDDQARALTGGPITF